MAKEDKNEEHKDDKKDKSSGKESSFACLPEIKDDDEKELNFDGLIRAGEPTSYYVYVDGVKYYWISFINLSDVTVKKVMKQWF